MLLIEDEKEWNFILIRSVKRKLKSGFNRIHKIIKDPAISQILYPLLFGLLYLRCTIRASACIYMNFAVTEFALLCGGRRRFLFLRKPVELLNNNKN